MDSILGGFILLLQVAAGFPVFLLVYYAFDFVENSLTEWGSNKICYNSISGYPFCKCRLSTSRYSC